MDKKNTTIGILLLAAAFALIFFQQRRQPPQPEPVPTRIEPEGPSAPTAETTAPESSGEPAPQTTITPAPDLAPATPRATESDVLFAAVENERQNEQFVSLSNDFIEARFSNFGGAIAEVVLKKYPAEKNGDVPYVLNALRTAPALSLVHFSGADADTPYTLVSQSADTIVWRAVVADQVEITRTYSISTDPASGDPYLLRHETTFRNLTDGPLNTPKLVFNLGTAEPVNASDRGYYLNVGAYDGDKVKFIGRTRFSPGFLTRVFGGDTTPKSEIEIVAPSVWASVKNQFFTTVLTPDTPGAGVTAQRVELPLVEGEDVPRIGITGNFETDGVRLEPRNAETLGFNFYAGPKEYGRLAKLSHREDKIMQFGFFGFFSKLLLTLFKALYRLVPNWGVAIIGTTLILRTMMWPITASASKSAKRMAKIQGPMREIQEKYKDDKRKQQEETLKLFKQHKINPLGGCLPMFIQIPIFFGLFRMLQSASELRFAEFLWVPDLSAPDTVAHISGFPLNVMPLLMGVSMVVQMRMTPTPSTDNASAKMMKFMPFFITFVCYNFSSGLAVYWTASNLFSIFQQWVTNRRRDPVETLPSPAENKAARKPHRDPHQSRKKKR